MSEFVVIGAGVNGLAAALELARAGKKVTVVEARNAIGGMSARRKFGDFEVPGLRHDTCEIRPELVASLGLAEHGLTLLGEHAPVFASDEKDGLVVSFDPAAAREEIARRSAKDAERYSAFRTLLGSLKPVVSPLLNKAPPPLLPRGMSEMADMGLLGMKLRGLGGRNMTEIMRAAPMCVADWMREQFETEILSATLALPAVQGDFVGPWSPGTAAFLILRETMAVPGVQGGPAAVVDALQKALKARGVEVKTGAKVTRIKIEGGRAKAVTLATGEEIAADTAVLAACSPKQTLNDLLPPLSLNTHDQGSARTMRSRGTVAKIHLGLAEPAKWRGRPGRTFTRIRAGGAHLDDLERAFDAAKYRQLPARPVLDISAPTPQVLSILVSAVPYALDGGWSDASKKALLDSVLTVLEEHAPGARASVKASEVLSPVDIESEFGAPGGSIHHVERALDQMVLMRPARPFARYGTPVTGLFVTGSGCHPGPGVTLAAGVLAARAALA